jgi:hypothetical protein
MNIFQIINNLFTSTTSNWILELDDKDINPVLIHRFLTLYEKSMMKMRILNKFVFTLNPKIYLSTVWSVLFFDGKKLNKAPFIKYIKKLEKKEKYGFIHNKVKRQFEMSDRDLQIIKPFIDKEIDKDTPLWFSYYGIDGSTWAIYNLDVELMKDYCKREVVEVKKGLDVFF